MPSLSQTGDVAEILTGAIALGTLGLAIARVRKWLLLQRLGRSRYRTVGLTLARLNPGNSSSISALRKDIQEQMRKDAHGRLDRSVREPAEELDWLAKLVDLKLPLTFELSAEAQEALAEAYLRLANALTVRGLFASEQPIHDEEAALARDLRELLLKMAAGRESPSSHWVQLAIKTDETISVYGPNPVRGVRAVDLVISWRRVRHSAYASASTSKVSDVDIQPVELTETERKRVDEAMNRPHIYDGVLPALAKYRLERDPLSGRDRLHLALTETTYSTVVALRSATLGAVDDKDAPPRTITLSAIPITSDGYMLFAQRPTKAPSYPGMWAPGVNGNLEMPDPFAKDTSDRDSSGMPDLIQAIVRETREELNIGVKPGAVAIRGLGRISTSDDSGTWVLATTAAVEMTAAEVGQAAAFADPVEGRWEFGNKLLTVKVPQEPGEAEMVLRWAWFSSKTVMPHVAVALAAYLSALGFSVKDYLHDTAGATDDPMPDWPSIHVPKR